MPLRTATGLSLPLAFAHPTYMDAQGWHTALKVEFTGLEGWADCRSRRAGGPGPP